MADYKVVYTMIDNTKITQEIHNRQGGLESLTNDLTRNGYVTHICSKGDAAVVINNRNVLYMEVSEL